MTGTPAAQITPEGGTPLFGTTAIACYVLATVGLVSLHALRPDYIPQSHMISDYAVGPYGWVMQSVFACMSLGSLSLAIGLASKGPRSILARVAILLLGVCSVGLVISLIYPTDVQGASTRAGGIHDMSFLANVMSSILAIVLLSVSFGRDPRWRGLRRPARWLMVLVLAALVAQFMTLKRGMPYGIANRFFVLVVFSWSLVVAFQLRAVEKGEVST